MVLSRVRTMGWSLHLATGLTLSFLVTSCSQPPDASQDAVASADSPLKVSVQPQEMVLTAAGDLSVRVTIRNAGKEPQAWGHGSSHCRLSLRVLVDGTFLEPGPPRRCTMDYVEHSLEPGSDYSEDFQWDGTVFRDGRPEALPSGEYELYGVAGDIWSAAVIISLQLDD